ncbi:uncharacterized protein ACRADG_004747 [Cochliomyia hominivorax]
MSKVIEIIDSDDDNQTFTDTTTSSNSLINNMEQEDNQQSQCRRRRRKSVLHAMPDPDMQFQTISLEDEEDDDDDTNSQPIIPSPKFQVKSSPRTLLKTPKISPKILVPKGPTNAEIVDANMDKFLNDPETINDVYNIAEERARINYLLSLNGMPEINFTLYTRPDRLQFQFEERLKQRKMLHNWDNPRTQDNRRSLLHKNNEPKKTT